MTGVQTCALPIFKAKQSAVFFLLSSSYLTNKAIAVLFFKSVKFKPFPQRKITIQFASQISKSSKCNTRCQKTCEIANRMMKVGTCISPLHELQLLVVKFLNQFFISQFALEFAEENNSFDMCTQHKTTFKRDLMAQKAQEPRP